MAPRPKIAMICRAMKTTKVRTLPYFLNKTGASEREPILRREPRI
jgi:hypothetical protein